MALFLALVYLALPADALFCHQVFQITKATTAVELADSWAEHQVLWIGEGGSELMGEIQRTYPKHGKSISLSRSEPGGVRNQFFEQFARLFPHLQRSSEDYYGAIDILAASLKHRKMSPEFPLTVFVHSMRAGDVIDVVFELQSISRMLSPGTLRVILVTETRPEDTIGEDLKSSIRYVGARDFPVTGFRQRPQFKHPLDGSVDSLNMRDLVFYLRELAEDAAYWLKAENPQQMDNLGLILAKGIRAYGESILNFDMTLALDLEQSPRTVLTRSLQSRIRAETKNTTSSENIEELISLLLQTPERQNLDRVNLFLMGFNFKQSRFNTEADSLLFELYSILEKTPRLRLLIASTESESLSTQLISTPTTTINVLQGSEP